MGSGAPDAVAPKTAGGAAPAKDDIMARLLYSYVTDFGLKYRTLAIPVPSAASPCFPVDNRQVLFDKLEMELT